jgi:hypothetical protein
MIACLQNCLLAIHHFNTRMFDNTLALRIDDIMVVVDTFLGYLFLASHAILVK